MADVLTVAEAAGELKLSKSAVYRALEEGRMPGLKPLGPRGPWRILRSEFEEWLTAQRPEPRRGASADPMPRPRRAGRFRAEVVELNARRTG